MVQLIWKENHKLAEQTVSLACNIALQPTHMLKREGGFKWLHVYTVAGWYTVAEILIQWLVDVPFVCREGKDCSNSTKSSRSSFSSVFLAGLQDWPVSVVPVLWCCFQWEGIVCAWCVCWHQLNISIKPAWWWKVGWKEREEEERKHFSGSNKWEMLSLTSYCSCL